MLSEREEKVIQLIKRKGPILPIEISKEMGIETFLAGAILSTLIGKGHLKISYKKIGSSPLYYIEGQENIVRNKLYPELNELEKKALERLKKLKVAFEEDLYPQERVLLNELRDFVSVFKIKKDEKELICWKHHSVSKEEFNLILKKKFEPKKEIKKESFEEKILDYFKKNGIEVIESKRGKKEYNYLVSFNSKIGKQFYIVKAKDKKSINESDISKFFIEILNKKIPGIFLVKNPLNKKLKRYVEENFGNFLNVIEIEKEKEREKI